MTKKWNSFFISFHSHSRRLIPAGDRCTIVAVCQGWKRLLSMKPTTKHVLYIKNMYMDRWNGKGMAVKIVVCYAKATSRAFVRQVAFCGIPYCDGDANRRHGSGGTGGDRRWTYNQIISRRKRDRSDINVSQTGTSSWNWCKMTEKEEQQYENPYCHVEIRPTNKVRHLWGLL